MLVSSKRAQGVTLDITIGECAAVTLGTYLFAPPAEGERVKAGGVKVTNWKKWKNPLFHPITVTNGSALRRAPPCATRAGAAAGQPQVTSVIRLDFGSTEIVMRLGCSAPRAEPLGSTR